jgi:hypothetical protein
LFTKEALSDGGVLLVETLGRPTVYLDNWALNDIALDDECRDRFVTTLNDRKGTLRLSISNLVELMKQTDSKQIETILQMVDSVDAGFINTNFVEVIKHENALLRGEAAGNPSQELTLIWVYLLAQNWPESWAMSDVIRTGLDGTSGIQMRVSWDQFAVRMRKFLDSVRMDREYMSKSKGRAKATRKKGKDHDRPTRELISLGFDFILQNESMKMSSNEWHDFLHAIVPASYCDIVLLDKRWSTFVCQTGISFPDAAFVYDKKSINGFFSALATGDFA